MATLAPRKYTPPLRGACITRENAISPSTTQPTLYESRPSLHGSYKKYPSRLTRTLELREEDLRFGSLRCSTNVSRGISNGI